MTTDAIHLLTAVKEAEAEQREAIARAREEARRQVEEARQRLDRVPHMVKERIEALSAAMEEEAKQTCAEEIRRLEMRYREAQQALREAAKKNLSHAVQEALERFIAKVTAEVEET